jgi:hypothetical protein
VSLWWWPALFLADLECISELHSVGWGIAAAITVGCLVIEYKLSGWRPTALILPASIISFCSLLALLANAISNDPHA